MKAIAKDDGEVGKADVLFIPLRALFKGFLCWAILHLRYLIFLTRAQYKCLCVMSLTLRVLASPLVMVQRPLASMVVKPWRRFLAEQGEIVSAQGGTSEDGNGRTGVSD